MIARFLGILSLLLFVLPDVGLADPLVVSVDAVRFNVKNISKSREFYTQVLGFEVVPNDPRSDNIWRLRLGDQYLELREVSGACATTLPEDSRSNDNWFQHVAIVVSDMDRAYRLLREKRVTHVSSGPQTIPDWNKDAAGIRAFYFQDPDGHNLELIWFPPDKGDKRWHRPGAALFQGIDHTAITVSHTEDSLKFYLGKLGLSVSGSSENWGVEQEHLNNVFGARLVITGLRAKSGIGIELLEYISPPGGRVWPTVACQDDVRVVTTTVELSAERIDNFYDPDGHRIIALP